MEPYFLGSIVLVKNVDMAEAQVIDGQQRRTTLTTLLAVLSHLSESKNLRDSFERMISEPSDELQQLEQQPRLRHRSHDRAFFRRFVQEGRLSELLLTPDGKLKNDAQKNVRNNATTQQRGSAARGARFVDRFEAYRLSKTHREPHLSRRCLDIRPRQLSSDLQRDELSRARPLACRHLQVAHHRGPGRRCLGAVLEKVGRR